MFIFNSFRLHHLIDAMQYNAFITYSHFCISFSSDQLHFANIGQTHNTSQFKGRYNIMRRSYNNTEQTATIRRAPVSKHYEQETAGRKNSLLTGRNLLCIQTGCEKR